MEKENVLFNVPNLAVNIKTLSSDNCPDLRDTHFHKEIELVRVDKGQLCCVINKLRIFINEGDVLFINSRTLHKLVYVSDNTTFTYLQVDIDRYINTLLQNQNSFFSAFMSKGSMLGYSFFNKGSEISYIFSDIENEVSKHMPHFDIYIRAKIFNMAAFMCRNGLYADFDSLTDKNKIKKIMPAVLYAEKNYHTKIHLDDLCDKININKYYFCKLFKSITGSTFVEYVNFVRLSNSEKALTETDKSISEIAFECGFTSIQYFNKAFKNNMGSSPSKYRKLHCSAI